jgi:hypothetical protein
VSHDNKIPLDLEINDHSTRDWDKTASAHASIKSPVSRPQGGSMASVQNDKLAGNTVSSLRQEITTYAVNLLLYQLPYLSFEPVTNIRQSVGVISPRISFYLKKKGIKLSLCLIN